MKLTDVPGIDDALAAALLQAGIDCPQALARLDVASLSEPPCPAPTLVVLVTRARDLVGEGGRERSVEDGEIRPEVEEEALEDFVKDQHERMHLKDLLGEERGERHRRER